ncbi:hypothetical protein QBC33DRAFT_552257 [Phialemonium atrogriseum]|uniref:Uncharacterized protein n=1 Tax=Phialemonium atrogriseum TaxID=1093897 RepID=A0AAJ0BSP4_9PEZI|nr:uncharacterized protein QBC33DRAFT_552257 [Phialemonium atrogriseum]KAK1762307.1 hypothetical protein QBC33DRAFT_552257 [Phialemonium atrogriseum]
MGNNTAAPFESAPSYDDLFADHPVNGQPPSGSSEAYTRVPQEDNQEARHHDRHSPNEIDLEASASADTPLRTLSGGSKPHVHCDACDKIAARRENRGKEMHCCSMVAATFIVAFVCLTIMGSVIAGKKYHHD